MNPLSSARVEVDPGFAKQMVGNLCQGLDLPVRETFYLTEVVELLDAAGYTVDQGVVAIYAARGYIALPAGGRWTPVDVVRLGNALELRRRWKPAPCVHDVKKNRAELRFEKSPGEFAEAAATATLADLVLQLWRLPAGEERDYLYLLAKTKMESSGDHQAKT